MKLPRDVSGRALGKALVRLGYECTRQVGSHMQFVTHEAGEFKVTIPDHPAVKTGTLSNILRRIATHHGITRAELLRLLFS